MHQSVFFLSFALTTLLLQILTIFVCVCIEKLELGLTNDKVWRLRVNIPVSPCLNENKQLHVWPATNSLYSFREAHITFEKSYQMSDFPIYLRKQYSPDFNFRKTEPVTFAGAIPVIPL